jgi:hypothetical protein
LPAFFHFFALAASTKSSKSFPSNSSLPTQKRQRRRLRRSDVLHSWLSCMILQNTPVAAAPRLRHVSIIH